MNIQEPSVAFKVYLSTQKALRIFKTKRNIGLSLHKPYLCRAESIVAALIKLKALQEVFKIIRMKKYLISLYKPNECLAGCIVEAFIKLKALLERFNSVKIRE